MAQLEKVEIMAQTILSVGIDVGTTTTQLIFSRLTLSKKGGFGCVPRVQVTNRAVCYRSPVYRTPLTAEDKIDAAGVMGLIREAFQQAGVTPEQVDSGAVILTGETARKRNARDLALELSSCSGAFVVAAAGPDLEGFLAGKGAGADCLSLIHGGPVLNLDIGGATANLCLFQQGEEVDCGCVDLGGRAICVNGEGIITRLSPKMPRLLEELGLPLGVGDRLEEQTAERIAAAMAVLLGQGANLRPMDPLGRYFLTNHGLRKGGVPTGLSFSGGVSDCIGKPEMPPFLFGDMGVMLGRAIRADEAFGRVAQYIPKETIRATVIGAGTYSITVSGSTIANYGTQLPLKNLPVYHVSARTEQEVAQLPRQLREAIGEEDAYPPYAIWLDVDRRMRFPVLEEIARALAEHLGRYEERIPVVLEQDCAKALGQALRRRMGPDARILCVDGIRCHRGDFLDIGQPVEGGIAVPVVVKTLVFQPEGE